MSLELSPYFKSLARVPRVCPSCRKHKLALEPLKLTWDAAVWKCDGCGWFQTELAPEGAKLGERVAKQRARIISVDFGGGRRER